MKKIKIGQIGIGHNHGEGKMKAVRTFPEIFDVVGVTETDPEWLEKRKSLEVYKGLKWMTTEELLAVEGLDAVLVETDVWRLVPTAQRCIDAGLHIHMDKPAGEDIDAYAQLLSDAKRQNLTVQLGYMYRYNPAVRYCIDAVRSGELGDVFEVDAAMSTEHSAEFRTWLKHFKGGTMYIFGCHLIDLILTIQGWPQRIISFQKETGFDGVDVFDNGLAVFEYPRGTTTVRTTSVEVNGYGRRQLVVCGSKGSIEIKPLERPTVLSVTLKDYSNPYQDVRRVIDLPDAGDRYDAMMLDFAGMVRGECVNPYTYEHELSVQKATLKACGKEAFR
ncbi:MAG: Gfo/Idh/MocA family oxidoreductase [Bacillota bacterium]|nr:Gfo/Idh/MocA family oxidoreductase [Bacillota bacterium]